MIIFFPIVPILVAIVVLVLSLLVETSLYVDVMTTVGWILVIVLSLVLIACNIFRKTSIGNKVGGSAISIIATIISLIESQTFLFGLAETDTSSVMGTIEFGFVLLFGGAVWLACIGLCAYASFNCIDEDYDNEINYLFSVLAIIGSLALGGIFGLLG